HPSKVQWEPVVRIGFTLPHTTRIATTTTARTVCQPELIQGETSETIHATTHHVIPILLPKMRLDGDAVRPSMIYHRGPFLTPDSPAHGPAIPSD
ncbi:hypothetical protein FRB99_001603, partial [Tulasnella sp. 403]